MTCGKSCCNTLNARTALRMPMNSWHREIVSWTRRSDSKRGNVVSSGNVTQRMNNSSAIHNNRLHDPCSTSMLATGMHHSSLVRATVQDPGRTLSSQNLEAHISKPLRYEIYLYTCLYICLCFCCQLCNICGSCLLCHRSSVT